MEFLFHAVTHTFGIYKYWNIYRIDMTQVCYEDLGNTHACIRMKISEYVPEIESKILTDQAMVSVTLIKALEEFLINEKAIKYQKKRGRENSPLSG